MNTIKQQMKETVRRQTTENIKWMINSFYHQESSDVDIALSVCLDVLMERIPTSDYVKFCDDIYNS